MTLLLRLAPLLCLGAVACSGPTTIGPPYRSPATGSTLVYTAAQGPVLLEVFGDPFGDGLTSLVATVATEMSGQQPSYPITFTPARAEAFHPDVRVVVGFGVIGGELCGTHPANLAAPDHQRRVSVTAAFCAKEQELSSVNGWVEDVDGAKDRRFAFLMADLVRQLFG